MVLLREGRGEIGKERQREGETERERERKLHPGKKEEVSFFLASMGVE